MEDKYEKLRRRFLLTLRTFREEGKVFVAFRKMELKAFETYKEAADFVKKNFAPDEVPADIERIDKVIREVEQGKITNWIDSKYLEPYLAKEKKASKMSSELMEKKRNRGPTRKRR